MAIFFVSDNSYFLLGIEETLVKKGEYCIHLFNTNDGIDNFAPFRGDVIIVSIKDFHMREKIMKLSIVKLCRVMMMLSMPVYTSNKTCYPWLLQKKSGINELATMISRAKKTPVRKSFFSDKVTSMFHCLGEGKEIRDISIASTYSVNHLYQIKRNLINRLGLSKYNALGVLICRDIIHATYI